MVKINEYERTATFAWSYDSLPLLASGSAAGAVDMDFSSSSKLEIFNVLENTNDPIASCSLDTKFYGLDWSKPNSTNTRGIIAGALENGVVQLWDAHKLIQTPNSDEATIVKGTKHTGAVKTVQFNPTQESILASAGTKGEIFIWDTNKFDELSSPGKAMTPMEDITCLSWNYNVKHVFASAGTTGYTSIWDLRAKKEVLHLTYTGTTGRCNLSVCHWNPLESTQLLTLSDNDNAPYILSWNLRNPKEPERILEGHTKGVLSMDWCKQDNELLLTCGKDNSTILWDPINGVKLGQYPTTANWVFETKFAPKIPDIFASSSFDGKVVIQSLQDTSSTSTAETVTTDAAAASKANADDFWGQLASTETQQPEFEVKKLPKWLKRPTSVSFGFGGKLVHVTQPAKDELKSVVTISKFVTDTKFADEIKLLNKSMLDNDFTEIVKENIASSEKQDKSDWELLLSLLKKDNLELLKEQIEPVVEKKEVVKDGDDDDTESKPVVSEDNDGFFDNLGKEQDLLFEPPTGDFKIFGDSENATDLKLTKLILKGNFADAANICIEEKRFTELLIISLNCDDSVKEKVKNSYFHSTMASSSFARVLYNASSNDVTDIVTNGDISNWKEIASAISTFTKDPQEFSSKISELGDRVLKSDIEGARNAALICYASSGAIDRISSIWLKEVNDYEQELLKSSDSITTSDAHFKALNQFVEKITVYRAASNITGEFGGPGIDKLCNALLEYSNIISNLGEFDLADTFLKLLPSSTEQLKIEKDRVMKASSKKPVQPEPVAAAKRSSYAKATPYLAPGYNSYLAPTYNAPTLQTPTPVPSQKPVATNGYTPLTPLNPYAAVAAANALAPLNPYAAVAANSLVPSNPYAAVAANAAAATPLRAPPSNNPYAPTTALDSMKNPGMAPVAPNGSHMPPPPPQSGSSQPILSAQSKAGLKDAGGWNDLPVHLGVKNTRATTTPSPYSSIAATAAQQQQMPRRPDMTSRMSSFTQPILPPPPPAATASATPSVNASPRTLNASAMASPPPPRSSKYAPPPSLATPTGSNGYSQPSVPQAAQLPPPPPPANPYAPKLQTATTLPNPYAPPPPLLNGYAAPTEMPLHQRPQSFGNSYAPPPLAASVAGSASVPPPPPPLQLQMAPPPPPAKERHPIGDRSHIPSSDSPIFEVLGSTLRQTSNKMPEKYQKQIIDTEKRLNILFEHLNNEELDREIVSKLLQVSNFIQQDDLNSASSLQSQIALDHPVECGQWMVGLKRLIQMTEAANR